LQAGRAGVDDLILALPADARTDPGLTMDRYLWRVGAKQHEGAQALMLEASTSAQALRDPAVWAPMRVDYARLAMRNGDWSRAEALARPHFLPPDNRHYADLEWLAGFAALKTGAADRALANFRHLETVVGSQISRSRAFYWQGRAHEALGDGAADKAFAKAAELPGTYYGQLAAERIGATMPADYATPGPLPDWRASPLGGNGVFQAGLWLLATGRADEAQRFFLHLSETADPQDTLRMARLMYEAGMPWHGLRLSKRAADKGLIHPAAHFPLTGLQDADLEVPPELVLSIARQESEFNPAARSPVGARGLMQVMPATAEQMARRIREPYSAARLTTDGAYNARLGAAYLAGLRDRFGASTALTASGYNAGPGRPARWLRDFGDLRRDADPVEWVELIPFDETRNYVMRVTEAMPVYRARILGRPAPIVPTWDLTGGGLMPPPVARLTLALSARPVEKPFIGPRLPEGWQPVAVEASAR
jgi:soluble lytic murein transglycosylase